MVQGMGTPALALFSYLVFGVVTLIWLPVMALLRLASAPFDRDRRLVGRLFRLSAVVISKACPLWRMRIEGALPDLSGRAHVVVSNHESIVDIFLLSHLPWEMKWLAKASAFRLPLIGLMMRLAGDIPVVRGDRTSGDAALERARRYLARGTSVMIFPEGTRTRSGELLPFKLGAFRLAIETGCPILPIAVHGSADAMPTGSPWIRRASPVARVLSPIEVHGLTADDAESLARRVRGLIGAARDELVRGRRASPVAPAELATDPRTEA